MEEEVCACRHCGLTYGAWRARLWKLRAGLSLLALAAIAAAMTLMQPWHAIALTAATALGCVFVSTFSNRQENLPCLSTPPDS